jgi:hypothetical protein
MSTVKYMGHVETEMMKLHITGDAISYVEVDIKNPSYACMAPSCGLIWDRMHHAESCESRGHVATWYQGYGGYVINGVYKPANSYPRTAIGQLASTEIK